MHKCKVCGAAMIRASSYDPGGEIPLHEGYKEFNVNGSLKEWWVCINPSCENGKKNTKGGKL